MARRSRVSKLPTPCRRISEYDADVTIWRQGVFRPSAQSLSDLVAVSKLVDFAAFVFAPDDVATIRGQKFGVVRDNVVFELGVFFGALGMPRCFYIVPRDCESLHLPTDLLGVAPLSFRSKRSDGNLVAALGTACNQIRRAFRENVTTGQSRPSLEAYIEAWNGISLTEARQAIRTVVLDHYSDEWHGQREDFKKVFVFLESLSDAILAGVVDEKQARHLFGDTVKTFWPVACVMLGPPNQADEWWDPLPNIAELYKRWAR